MEEPKLSFSPGKVLLRRYRIHRRIGSGSMGDVYRALDARLGTVVALKVPTQDHPEYKLLKGLLPEEVRLAQQVSHPNVCRVVDLLVGEQLMALSMEYINGETLERILQSRFEEVSPGEKLRVAHEICMGLGAIHRSGLIHRDLKPANVMVDSQGRAVILDFGLASEARAMLNPAAGNDLYRAPEQKPGGEVTAKADLYALGLLVFELLTGERPDRTASLDHRTATLQKALSVSQEQAAGLARRIHDCLAENPASRPESAEAVADALPCDPDALPRDTSTPVYRLLTEPRTRMSPRAAGLALAATVLGLALVVLLSQWTQPSRPLLRGLPPSELEIRAQEILVRSGFEGGYKDRRSGFAYTQDPDQPVLYWYRQSPERLAPWRKGSAFRRYEDPPFSAPGEVGVQLDLQGRLVRLDRGPADRSGIASLRIPGSQPAAPLVRSNAEESRRGQSELGTLIHGLGFGGVLLGVLWLARRRLREQMADKPAAFRLAVFVFGARVVVGLLGVHRGWSPIHLDSTMAVFSRALLVAALVWIVYIAVEPWVRYSTPELTASWIRLIYRRWTDPLVGRDLLIGGLFGLALPLWARLYALVPGWLGLTPPRLDRLSPLLGMLGQDEIELQIEAVNGLPRALAMASYALVHGLLLAFLLVGALILLRRLLVRPWLSRSVAFLLYVVLVFPQAGDPALDLIAALGTAALGFTVLFRYGFLPTVTAIVVAWVLSSHPLTNDPWSWVATGALIPVLSTLGLSIWGFRAARSAASR